METPKGKEPSEEQIEKEMKRSGDSYYNVRERLRNSAYGQLPPGYHSWGDYWKSL